MSWGIWIATAVLIGGVAVFLDKYHVSEDARDSTRSLLIRFFVFVDKARIPNFAHELVRFVRRLWGSWWHLGLVTFILFAYWAIVSTFYIGRDILGAKPTDSYWMYLVTWIPFDRTAPHWIAVLLWGAAIGLIALLVCSKILSKITPTSESIAQLGYALLSSLVGWLFVFIGAGGSLLFFSEGPTSVSVPFYSGALLELPLFSLFLSFVAVTPSFIIVNLVFWLILVRLFLRLLKFVSLRVFDAASAPENSPFAYASALIGVCVLLIKLVKELAAV